MREEATPHLRCKPGDLARVIHSINPALIDQIVVVEGWREEHGRWAVCLLGRAVLGVTLSAREPTITSRYGFRDSSLEPLPPEIAVACGMAVSHQRRDCLMREASGVSA